MTTEHYSQKIKKEGVSLRKSPTDGLPIGRDVTRYRNNKRNKAGILSSRLAYVADFIDGQGGNRTPDTRIFSPLLYQLSYLASKSEGA